MTGAEAALERELRFHRRLFRPGRIVDIGAHSGAFALPMAALPGAEVVAIEPLVGAVRELERRSSESGTPIRVIAAALGDRNSRAMLSVPLLHNSPVWEWASLAKDFDALRREFPEITGVERFQVAVRTLDELALDGVTAIKLDVEGAEYRVLRDARATLARERPIVSAELEERHQVGCTYAVPAFMDALRYACFFEIDGLIHPFEHFDRAKMQRGGRSPADHDYSDPYVNCFYFIPKENRSMVKRFCDAYPSAG